MTTLAPHRRLPGLTPTAVKQSWGFMIGSSFFAVAAALSIGGASATVPNLLCFVGAWFFTGAGLIQTIRSAPRMTTVPGRPHPVLRAEWLGAATQSFGTVMFNISTTSALYARTVVEQDRWVWSPDAGGSVAFLVSGYFILVAYSHANGTLWAPASAEWWSAQINMLGCIAFGFSAVGAYVLPDNNVVNSAIANWGTLIGAICFFLTSLVVLPAAMRARRQAPTAQPA
ncbi:hypothetical protein [Serinibacter salmoneus]|uniref:YrhK-like protein n=1 Tax=Serinibacter salmoneus TaxID=556530 RepID=A0A2A9D3S2_9MICO|nr:hypothetical protein [Serinibacter salmoneus]PFG20905.1 hypothetical protein ATL40_2521 [Serinibacter salmoneus]